MESDLPETIYDIETPCFLVDLDIVERNCKQMSDRCEKMGVELRPHMKTHKTIEGGVLMTNGTKKKIVVSTIPEAQLFAENGFTDIILGKPLVKEIISKRVIRLAEQGVDFQVFVDSIQGLDGVLATPLSGDNKWKVWLEVDCGLGRTGCRWDSEDAVTIVRSLSTNEKTEFQGLYAHCGNSYTENPDEKEGIQSDTTMRLIELRDKLTAEGLECKKFGSGSTPSCSRPIPKMAALTEFHPGNYIFYDYMQVIVGSCEMDDIACRVATTVLSHKPEVQTLVVDCGWTAIGLDGQTQRFNMPLGMSPVQGHPELQMAGMTQELGKLKATSGDIDYSKYPTGSRLFLFPFHSCQSASLHKVYYIHRGDKIVGMWKPVSGW